MKKLTLILALMCMPVMAEPVDCAVKGELAKALMTARQSGVPMSTLMTMEDLSDIKPLIIEVYKTSVERTNDGQRRAINSFRDEMLMVCYQNQEESK